MSKEEQKLYLLEDKLEKIKFNYKLRKSQLKKNIKREEEEIKKLEKQKCLEFRKEHKKLFFTLDMIIVILIFFNLGALLITNALVVKANPDGEFMEANPVVGEIHDFEVHPEGKIVMTKMMFFIIIWSFLTLMYIFRRNRINEKSLLYQPFFILIFYTLALTTDFVNDLGYYIGVKLWGI